MACCTPWELEGTAMRVLLPLLALLAALAFGPAQAFELPGLANDAGAYERGLSRKYPAGATPAQRQAAEQRAATAEAASNWAAAAAALEDRVAGGEATAEHWLRLARAQLRRTPPENARALQAAWMNFQMVPAGAPELPSLVLMAEALGRLDRVPQQLETLAEVVQRAPDNQAYRRQLAEARRAAGMLVARIHTEAEAEPARACLAFTIAPARREDWKPQDWVRAEPAIPGLAVTREGDEICVAGLPHGRTTRLVLRAGLPGEDNQSIRRDTTVNLAIANRAPRIVFDSSAHLLPRGQEQRVQVTTINLTSLKLRVVRVTERNLVPVGRDWKPGDAIDGWAAENFTETWGRVVWEGTATLAAGPANATQRSALELPAALRESGPGLFVLIATAADGTRNVQAAALPLIATDLGLTAWRSSQGLAAQVRALGAAQPIAGALVRLMATNNEILGEATSGADGLVRFAAALLAGTGPMAPKALQALQGDDLVQLDLEQAAFDLSDRGAGGMPHPGPLDAFVWLDRGIYRPGETVQAAALLRDGAGAPVDLPARFRVRRPGGQVFAEAVPAREPGAAALWAIPLSAGAQSGLWSIEVLADPNAPPIGTAQFRVDAFVPERLEVTAGPAPGALRPGTPLAVPVTARFLYGAPGAGLTGNGELKLVSQRGLEAFPGYVFGAADEQFSPDAQQIEIAALDPEGKGRLTLALDKAPDTTRPLRGDLTVSIDEPGGRATRTTLVVPVQAQERLIGVKPAFTDDAIDADAEAGFEIVALNAQQQRAQANLRLRLVRERPSWRLVMRGSLARYETVWTDEAVDSTELRAGVNTPGRYSHRLPFGRYRLEVTEPGGPGGGLALTSYRFRSGWAPSQNAEVPDKVDVSADRRQYNPGETARLRINPPFGGQASVAVLTDRLVSMQDVAIPAGGAEVTVPVDAAWGAGAYIAITVFRPGEARNAPGRALGLTWLQIAPDSRRIAVEIAAPERVLPRQRVTIPLKLSNAGEGNFDWRAAGAMLTLAAVDEGILRLTRFATPDPVPHFMGKRRLGVDIRDDYGRLIQPTDAAAAALRTGGDGLESLGTLDIPQRTVALFSGPVAVAADGTASVTLEIPDFAGELRLMAVAWQGNRSGSAAKALTVRDPVVAEALLPRFLAPGDEARLPLLLHNLDLPEGEIAATLTAQGAIALSGPARLTQHLAQGARALPATGLRATASGEGVLRLAVAGPGGFAATHEYRITVRSSRPVVTEVSGGEIASGREVALAPPLDRFLAGSWRASVSIGGPTRYDVAGMQRYLDQYPFACLEQSSSRLLALAAYPETPNRAGAMQQGVESVLNRQRYDGAFGLWSAGGSAEPWLSPYAVEALLRAKQAGAAVPEAALEEALKYLLSQVEEASVEEPEERAAQAYRLHVLALAGRHRLGAARRLMEGIDRLPTPLAKAQLASAFARAGDRERAEAAFAAALAAPARRPWAFDYGDAARDALATALLLKESGLLPERLTQLMARLPGPELNPNTASTQDQGWAVAAAQALGRDAQPPQVALNGRPVTPAGFRLMLPLDGPARLKNFARASVWQSVAVTGIPREPRPAAAAGMRVARQFFGLDGKPLDVATLRQNQVFVLLLEGAATDREQHRALLQQGLPAGWEIVSRFGSGAAAGMAWLGELSEVAATPALDDRYAAALDLGGERAAFRVAVKLRAVTAGRFELPGVDLSDMYRPAVFARGATARVRVLGADEAAPTPPRR